MKHLASEITYKDQNNIDRSRAIGRRKEQKYEKMEEEDEWGGAHVIMADVVVGHLHDEMVRANEELPSQRAEPGPRRWTDPLAREGRRLVRRTLRRLGSTCSRRGRSRVVRHGQPPHACLQGSSRSSHPGGSSRRLRWRRRRGRCLKCRGGRDRR